MTFTTTCHVKFAFSEDRKKAWLGQPHLTLKLEEKFGNEVKKFQKYKTPGTPSTHQVRELNKSLCLFRKSVFTHLGGLNIELKSAAWLDWFYRYREAGEMLPIYKHVIAFQFGQVVMDENDRSDARDLSIKRRQNSGLKKLYPFHSDNFVNFFY